MLRICNWDERFENNKTRDMKIMRWVPIEIDDDAAYIELVKEHKNGAAHYGAWIAIVKIAGRCTPRGTLVKFSPKGKPVPHDSKSLSVITRIPKRIFDAAIPRFLEIGWMEQDPDTTQLALFGTGSGQEGIPIREGRKEGKEGKEGRGKPGANIPPSPEEVTAYAESIGYKLNGQHFCDYYAQGDWHLKRGSKMKNWQAAVRTWKARDEEGQATGPKWEKGMITQEKLDAETPDQKAERLRKVDEHNRRVLER